MKIPYFQFDCSDDEIAQVTEVLKSGWLTTASKAMKLEEKFRAFCNVKHALAVNSCTSALHLALDAIEVCPDSKVIVPTMTFTSTAEVVRYLGATPIFVDVCPETCLMTGKTVEAAIKEHPDAVAVIAVHFGGQSAQLTGDDGIWSICQKHNVRLILDAAHAFPSFDDYGPVGAIGDATCFSFYANKTMTTAEGGMLVTNDDKIKDRAAIMRIHGINRDVWDRFNSNSSTTDGSDSSSSSSWEYDVVAPGYKYNLPDLNAAIGLAQFDRAIENRRKRQVCVEQYQKRLGSRKDLRFVESRVPFESNAWHLCQIVLNQDASVSRNELINLLNSDEIGTSVHYKPLHRLSYYKKKYELVADNFPNAEEIWNGTISLPLFPTLTDSQIQFVCDRIEHHLDASQA